MPESSCPTVSGENISLSFPLGEMGVGGAIVMVGPIGVGGLTGDTILRVLFRAELVLDSRDTVDELRLVSGDLVCSNETFDSVSIFISSNNSLRRFGVNISSTSVLNILPLRTSTIFVTSVHRV